MECDTMYCGIYVPTFQRNLPSFAILMMGAEYSTEMLVPIYQVFGLVVVSCTLISRPHPLVIAIRGGTWKISCTSKSGNGSCIGLLRF